MAGDRRHGQVPIRVDDGHSTELLADSQGAYGREVPTGRNVIVTTESDTGAHDGT